MNHFSCSYGPFLSQGWRAKNFEETDESREKNHWMSMALYYTSAFVLPSAPVQKPPNRVLCATAFIFHHQLSMIFGCSPELPVSDKCIYSSSVVPCMYDVLTCPTQTIHNNTALQQRPVQWKCRCSFSLYISDVAHWSECAWAHGTQAQKFSCKGTRHRPQSIHGEGNEDKSVCNKPKHLSLSAVQGWSTGKTVNWTALGAWLCSRLQSPWTPPKRQIPSSCNTKPQWLKWH